MTCEQMRYLDNGKWLRASELRPNYLTSSRLSTARGARDLCRGRLIIIYYTGLDIRYGYTTGTEQRALCVQLSRLSRSAAAACIVDKVVQYRTRGMTGEFSAGAAQNILRPTNERPCI
jgi:hypothetical protein